ncbi:hypothetical protein ACX9R5_00830 [Rathayibacter sp. CAU 1779]
MVLPRASDLRGARRFGEHLELLEIRHADDTSAHSLSAPVIAASPTEGRRLRRALYRPTSDALQTSLAKTGALVTTENGWRPAG